MDLSDFLIPIIVVVAVAFGIYKTHIFAVAGIKKHWLAIAFLFKIVLATVLLLFYQQKPREKSDIFRYWDDAISISNAFQTDASTAAKILIGTASKDSRYDAVINQTNHWDRGETPFYISNNRLIIRYLAICQLITFKSYYGTLALTVLLSFLGLLFVFSVFAVFNQGKEFGLFLIIFFLPGISLWTSGLLKESLLIFLIGAFLKAIHSLKNPKSIFPKALIIIAALFFIIQIRAYVALFMLLFMIPFLVNQIFRKWRVRTTYAILLLITMAFLTESKQIFGKSVFEILNQKREAIINQAVEDHSTTLFTSEMLSEKFPGNLIQIGTTLTDSFLRPYPTEPKALFNIVFIIENLIIISLLIFSILYPLTNPGYRNFLYWVVLFSLANLWLIGLSTPVTGAIVRYRAIPLMLLAAALYTAIHPKIFTYKKYLQRLF